MTVKKPSAERIAKYSGRPLSSFSVMRCYRTLLVRPQSFCTAWKFLLTVAYKFFGIQYLEKFHILRIPVKHVDHELDDRVPFKPAVLRTYLDFINYWLRNIAMLQCRFGVHEGTTLALEFLRALTTIYHEAFRMYSTCMTTTRQPACKDRAVKTMRLADPHFLCVPSLHISIICFTYSFYKMLFVREEFTEEEQLRWNRELYEHGLEIAESVLYLKQHSVNCIPAALYLVTKVFPGLFPPPAATGFINDLFRTADDIPEDDKKAIREHISFIYERFLLEGAAEDDWREPIIRWLDSYQPYGTDSKIHNFPKTSCPH